MIKTALKSEDEQVGFMKIYEERYRLRSALLLNAGLWALLGSMAISASPGRCYRGVPAFGRSII